MSAVELRPRNNDSASPITLSLGQQVTLGNSIIADYSFPQMGMEDIHCRISALRHGCFVECFSTNGTIEINGTPVNRIRLKSGDSVALGNLEFVVSVARPPKDARDSGQRPPQVDVESETVPDKPPELPQVEDQAVESVNEKPPEDTVESIPAAELEPKLESESPLEDQALDPSADAAFSSSTALNGTVWKHEIAAEHWQQHQFRFADDVSCFAIKMGFTGLDLQRIDLTDPDSFGREVVCFSRDTEQDVKERLYNWIQYLKSPTLFDRFIGMAPKTICQKLFDTIDAFAIVESKNQTKNLRLLTLYSPDELSKIVTQKTDSA